MLKGGSTRCRLISSASPILMKVGRTYSTRNALSISRFYFIKNIKMATSQRHLARVLKIIIADINIHPNRFSVSVF